MNIELDEVVVMDISDDALEQAASCAQGGETFSWVGCYTWVLAPAAPVTYNLGVCYEH
jgi:hypothetical protein